MSSPISELPGSLASTPEAETIPKAVPYYSPAPGQPFEPYTEPFSEKDSSPAVNAKWETTKIVLHVIGLVFSLVGFAMAGVITANATYMLWEYATWAKMNYAALAPVLIWDAAELITRAVRRRKSGRGIHPGAHVGISLIIWMICFFFTFIINRLEFPRQRVRESCDWVGGSTHGGAEYDECATAARITGSYGLALTVFVFLCGVVHFVLFVGACVDTNIRNRAAKRPRIIMVTNPQLSMRGWQPIPAAAVAAAALPGEINELPTIEEAVEKDTTGAVNEYYAPAHHAV